jgi:hypothetical protein
MPTKLDEVRRFVQELAQDQRLVFVSCIRYCHFDTAVHMYVDESNVSGDELHQFAQDITIELLCRRPSHSELADKVMDLIQNCPWGMLAATQRRSEKPAFAFFPPRQNQLEDDMQIGDWPSDVTIRGDQLISLYELTERKGHRLDVGVTEAGKR